MEEPETEAGPGSNSRAVEPPLPRYVDWLVGLIVAIGGLALTVGGTVLLFVVDRGLIEEGIESGRITVGFVERDLTRAEMLEFVLEVVNWTGIGLAVTGLVMVLFAIGFVVVRTRAQGRTEGRDARGSRLSYAVIGAVASAVLSFVPFSPILGGGIAGYLGRQDTGHTTSTGALSGFLYVIPALSILLFVTVGLFAGLAAVGESGVGFVVGTVMVLVLLVTAAYGAGLGALGGFLGGRLVSE